MFPAQSIKIKGDKPSGREPKMMDISVMVLPKSKVLGQKKNPTQTDLIEIHQDIMTM